MCAAQSLQSADAVVLNPTSTPKYCSLRWGVPRLPAWDGNFSPGSRRDNQAIQRLKKRGRGIRPPPSFVSGFSFVSFCFATEPPCRASGEKHSELRPSRIGRLRPLSPLSRPYPHLSQMTSAETGRKKMTLKRFILALDGEGRGRGRRGGEGQQGIIPHAISSCICSISGGPGGTYPLPSHPHTTNLPPPSRLVILQHKAVTQLSHPRTLSVVGLRGASPPYL